MYESATIFRFASRGSRPYERDAGVSSDEFATALPLVVNQGNVRNEGQAG